VVLAFGGNALTREGQAGTFEQQSENARAMGALAVDLLDAGFRVVVTHGNGPQVGNLAVQQEEGQRLVPAQPLFTLGAMTQGQIGHILALSLRNLYPRRALSVVSVVTHVLVDPADPAFQHPTKPIGPFFGEEQAKALARERGWQVVEDAGRGYRRVVPSPEPRAILEADAIQQLVEAGHIVIAAGGGGIPVIKEGKTLAGVDTVIDKDFAAERLAISVKAHALVLITGVDRVVVNFRTPQESPIDTMTVEEAQGHLNDGQFPPGSMGPKVTAAIRFVRDGGNVGIITSAAHARAALEGEHGTRIVPARERIGPAAVS
jgi:carbamate kinase